MSTSDISEFTKTSLFMIIMRKRTVLCLVPSIVHVQYSIKLMDRVQLMYFMFLYVSSKLTSLDCNIKSDIYCSR